MTNQVLEHHNSSMIFYDNQEQLPLSTRAGGWGGDCELLRLVEQAAGAGGGTCIRNLHPLMYLTDSHETPSSLVLFGVGFGLTKIKTVKARRERTVELNFNRRVKNYSVMK